MESAFSFDFAAVRVHTGATAHDAASALGARALTAGTDILFRAGEYLPGTPSGDRLLAHELAHVVQQAHGLAHRILDTGASDPLEKAAGLAADHASPAAEGEAQGAAMIAAVGEPVPALTRQPPTIARQDGLQRSAGNRAVTPLVQAQRLTRPAAVQRDADAGAPSLDEIRRVIDRADPVDLISLEQSLLTELARDPIHQAADVRKGIAEIRHTTMDRIAKIRDEEVPKLATASAGTAADSDAARDRLTKRPQAEKEMDAKCAPWLNVLAHGHPEYRYEHFNRDVQSKVMSAVELHAAVRGVDQVSRPADAEKESRREGGLAANDEWCGAFAYTQSHETGGLSDHWKVYMQGEGGIRSALAYAGMKNIWIWNYDHWTGLEDYHRLRGSVRSYTALASNSPLPDIQPGDLVLIDNAFGTNPDHIATVASFDGRYLRTIGGNEGTSHPVHESDVIDLANNPDPNDVTLYESPGKLRLSDKGAKQVDPTKGPKHWRVHGVGRWSIVDYEEHIYATGQNPPASGPSAQALTKVTAASP